ncbi:MAG: UDP-N-acetylmuramoyl-tripeptide--D-alanyl-D-alanine ligase [Cellvibrionaceae bacterium]|nr:UDP-N-acetylmuramoyl-tripeptide--D-alanyl-D-alanine ligase [Cellvibrionaceae bacterium]
MIRPLSLHQLQQRFGGQLINGDYPINRISIDSRQPLDGAVFVALQGKRFDGHHFLAQAIDRGAGALIINRHWRDQYPPSPLPVWRVDDTEAALANMAVQQRDNFTHKMVGITGSSGKTTVKGMLSAIFVALVGQQHCFVTPGNQNNHIGMPLSLFKITPQHHYVAIEMGASGLNEISGLTQIARPHVALVNNVMPAHLDGFGSVDNIARAKGEIYQGLGSDGVAIINGDDRYAPQWIAQNLRRQHIIFSTGQRRDAQVQATHIEKQANGCYRFLLHCGERQAPLTLSVLGVHNVSNALAAAACAHALSIDLHTIVKGLSDFIAEPGRLRVAQGINDSVLIDDAYNANPGSVTAAIDVLSDLPIKKILVLGDMAELGDDSQHQHQRIGCYAKTQALDYLLTLGEHARWAADAFGERAIACQSEAHMLHHLQPLLTADTAVLVKGSRSAHMEKIVHALKKVEVNACEHR